jgi:hypothetical protein
VLAIGLVVLWLAALSQHATSWLTWADVVAALCAFAIAAGAGASVTPGSSATLPLALSVGLAVLWIIGLASHASSWLAWWTFAFACAFLLIGVADGVGSTRQMTRPRPV